jgi:outer membrane protein assembly factor BamB
MSKKSFLFILTVLLSFSLTGCTVVGDMVDAYKKASRSFYFNDNVAPTLRYIDQEDKEKKEEEELNPAMKRYLEIGKNKTYYPAVNVSGLSIDKNADLGQFSFDHDIIYKGEKVKNYKRDESISFPKAQDYSFIEGITAFRGNHYRNTASYGVADIKSGKLEQIWEVSIGYIDTWTGVGWTGQPVIVKWPESTKLAMNLYSDKKIKSDLKEAIYGTLDGNIYFLDLEDGSKTRAPINTGFPIKGSVSVDPRGYPLLFAGQGINTNANAQSDCKLRIFNLLDQSLLFELSGNDPHAYRAWNAFDSNALIDAKTDTLIQAGENGIIYTAKLNSEYDESERKISINPEFSNYRYNSPYGTGLGVENSPVVYRNLIYFVDNTGFLQCVDLNTLTPVWAYNVTDDTDSTLVLEEISDNEVFLYTACEVDLQKDGGSAYIRKFNALTGKLLWEKSFKCHYDANVNGGVLATPAMGEYAVSHLIFYNIAKTVNTPGYGLLCAMDKNTGDIVWQVPQDFYSWSSPVLVYDPKGKGYLVACDSGGKMSLYDALSGKLLDSISLGSNVEGSPAVYDNMIVIGTRGQKIIGVKIK